MKSFFKTVLAVIVGMSIMIIFPLIFLIIISNIITSADFGKDQHEVEKNTVLSIDLSTPIIENNNQPELDLTNLSDFQIKRHHTFYDLLKVINTAKDDENIAGISLELKNTNLNYAQAKSIRDALRKFKTSGKFVYAFGDQLSQKDYYIGSVADSVFISPLSQVMLAGISAKVIFYKQLLDKVGVKFDIIKHGKYKSAVEPFYLSEMSPASKKQTQVLIGDIWADVSEDIGESRHLSKEKINLITDSLKGFVDQQAVQTGLIDGIRYKDDYQKLLKGKNRKMISFRDYLSSIETKFEKNQIAVIYANGEIKSGDGLKGIQDQTIIEQIRKARDNQSVKSVVLRIDSPGGDATACERILHELKLLKQKKPLIVSFGGVAASGGYYISTAADTIVSSANTITGSIGVFGTFPNIKKLSKRIGVSVDVTNTNANSNTTPLFEGITPGLRKMIRENIERVYDRFLTHVAQNRHMSKAAIDSLGQGRVWSGIRAKEKGLVDVLGDLNTAISFAAQKARIKNYDLLFLPRKRTEWEIIWRNLFGKDKLMVSDVLKQTFGDKVYRAYRTFGSLKQGNSIQARLPYSIQLK